MVWLEAGASQLVVTGMVKGSSIPARKQADILIRMPRSSSGQRSPGHSGQQYFQPFSR